jgi:hypothetical protein
MKGASPQNELRIRRWFLIGALMVVGSCGTILLRGFRTSESVTAKPDAESLAPDSRTISSGRTPMVLPELVTPESDTERLLRLVREKLAESNRTTIDLVGGPEWEQLLKADASAAMRLLEQISDRSQREQLLPILLKQWVKIDGTNAFHWAAQLPDPSERQIALRAGCLGLAESDPKVAIEIADRLFAGEQREVLLQAVGHQWAVQNLDDAMSWAKLRPPDESRDKLFLEMALVAAESAPEKGAQIAAEHISPGTAQSTAALSVLNRWVQVDFTSAAAWVNQFPESQMRDQAVLHLGRAAYYQSQQKLSGAAPSQ